MTSRPYLLAALLGSVGLPALSGCAHYTPAPVNVAAMATPKGLDAPLPADAAGLLRLALARDPALQAAKASLRAAEAGAKAARNRPPMTLTLTGEYSKEADAQRPWLYSGALDVPLDLGGRRTARVTTADIAVIKARYAVGDAVWTVRQTVRQSLTDLATSRAAIATDQHLLDLRTAYARLIEKRAAAGEDTRPMALQARLDASALVDNLLQAQARQAQARASLARILDVSPDALDELPDMALSPIAPGDLDPLTGRAFYIRQDVLNAVADYDSAENDLRAAVAGQYPDISLSPGYTWERGVAKLPLVGTFTLPPLDGNRANIRQAEAARAAAGKTLEDQVKTVRANIIQASVAYDSDRRLAEKTRASDLPLAQEMAARTERMKQAGESDQTEVLAAQIALAQSQLAVRTAEETALNDRLKLEDALHQSLDPAETAQLAAAAQAQEVTH